MAKKVTKRDEIKGIISNIQSQGWETFSTNTGTFYIADKDDSHFHVYFVYNNGVYKNDTFDEIYYNLKDRKVYLRRNESDLTFNEDNIRKSFGYMSAEDLKFLEVEGNAGLYQTAYRKLGAMYCENTKMVSRFLVRLMYEYPVLENIQKAGLDIDKVFSDLMDAKTMNINQALGFKFKSQLKLYRLGAEKDSRISKISARFIRGLDENQILYIFDMKNYAEQLDARYGLAKKDNIFNMNISSYSSFQDTTWQTFLRDIQEYDKTRGKVDEKRLIEYLFYELDVRQGITNLSGAMSEYRDYIRMASELGRKFERYPKSLKMRHDIALKYFNLVRNFSDNDGFKKSCELVKHLEGKIGNSGYSVIVPSTPEDIVDEGEQLSHCVKSYIEAIANGVCQIVFLRKTATPEEALYTVEIRQNSVVQFAGFQNCEPDDEAKAALSKWAKAFNLMEGWEGQTT